jgi:hypothetical protein
MRYQKKNKDLSQKIDPWWEIIFEIEWCQNNLHRTDMWEIILTPLYFK